MYWLGLSKKSLFDYHRFRCASGRMWRENFPRQPYMWHTRCDDSVVSLHFNAFFSLSSWNHWMRRCSFKTLRKKNINAEKMLFTSKLEPSRSHRMHIYRISSRDVLSPLHSHLAQESGMFRKPCKINASSTFKKHVKNLWCFFLHPTTSHVFKWKM